MWMNYLCFAITAAVLATCSLAAIRAGAYGLGLFVLVPAVAGFAVDWLAKPQTLGRSVGQSLLTVVGAALLFFATGIEGAICIVMMLPLAMLLAAQGAVIGYQLRARRLTPRQQQAIFLAALALAPAGLGAESAWKPEDPLFPVRTSLEIAAPPQTVWRHVVSFSELPTERDWLFHLGLAYPVRATIDGEGVGAVRHCEFSTGPFVEPITVWDPPRRLAFRVTASPSPMREWSLHGDVRAKHLDGYLVSHRGEFLLEPLDGGRRTRLTGTTWYQHHMQPAAYWRLWADWVIHRIHLRVLRHIATLAEV